MLLSTILLKPLAQASDRNARCLTDTGIGIAKTGLNERPDLVHKGGHELAATLHGDTKSKHGTAAAGRVGRGEIGADQLAERREDLAGREAGSETVDDAESRARGGILVNVLGLVFAGNREQSFKNGSSKVVALNL